MSTPSRQFTAIVLAGQRSGIDPVAAARGVTVKALAPVGGQAMILNVLDVLEASPWIDNIFFTLDDKSVAADHPRLRRYLQEDRIANSGNSICGSVVSAITEKNVSPPFIVVTADHALLTLDMVDHFCRNSMQNHTRDEVDFLLALVARRVFRAKYPHARRTFLRFRDDAYSGCNMYAFMTPRALRVLDFWIQCEEQRKKPWRLIRAFGFRNLMRYLLRRAGLQEMIAHGGRVVGLKGFAVTMPHAEAAIDVDTPQDLILAENILSSRRMDTQGHPAE